MTAWTRGVTHASDPEPQQKKAPKKETASPYPSIGRADIRWPTPVAARPSLPSLISYLVLLGFESEWWCQRFHRD